MIGFRQATLTDADAITRIEAESWPAFLAAPRSALASRISIYPSGQWLALRDQRIVGAAFAQRVHPKLLAASQPTYDRVTDNATFHKMLADNFYSHGFTEEAVQTARSILAKPVPPMRAKKNKNQVHMFSMDRILTKTPQVSS